MPIYKFSISIVFLSAVHTIKYFTVFQDMHNIPENGYYQL